MKADPLTTPQVAALGFYLRAFCREQTHASVRDLADFFGVSHDRARRLTDALHSKGYIYVMGGRVAAIKREIDGTRVRVMLMPTAEQSPKPG